MPPKSRVSRAQILAAAVELVRRAGADALNARDLAEDLGCSTQPIFSHFATMDALRAAVLAEAQTLANRAVEAEIARGEFPPYKAAGMAYIRFAAEERQLFLLLYMRDRSDEEIPESTPELEAMTGTVARALGLPHEAARLFHLEMWIFVHGVAAMIASRYLAWDRALVSRMLTDAYQGLVRRFTEKEHS